MVGLLVEYPRSVKASPAAYPQSRLRGRLGCSEHERRVATIATRLFDLLAAQHGLSKSYRALLHTAALVHDAARPLGADDHNIRGAELVLEDRSLDLTPWERRAVAYLVRYHRGRVPTAGEIILPGDGRRKLRVLLALLRAADALDSRRVPAQAIIVRRKQRKLRVHCLVGEELEAAARAALGRPRKLKMLEKIFKLRVQVRIEPIA